MEVHHLERVAADVRKLAREELVQGDAERVEIRAIIEAAIHPPGLLRGDVRERALERGGRLEFAFLAAQSSRDAEVDQRAALGLRIVYDVVTTDVLVNDAGCVDGSH